MADEPQKDENQSQAQSATSTDTQAQGQTATPPAGEQPVAGNDSGQGRVPYPRFHEVVEQRNQERQLREQYEGRLRELESRLPQNPNVDIVEQEAQRLARTLGLKPEAAREIATSQANIARANGREIQDRLNRYDVMAWSSALSAKHKDFAELAPDMDKVYGSLDQTSQKMVTGSPAGLEMFYGYVKSMKADGKLQEAQANGARQAYENKGIKQAVSSVAGTSSGQPKGKITQAAISAMSAKEYKERLPEINRALAAGEID